MKEIKRDVIHLVLIVAAIAVLVTMSLTRTVDLPLIWQILGPAGCCFLVIITWRGLSRKLKKLHPYIDIIDSLKS